MSLRSIHFLIYLLVFFFKSLLHFSHFSSLHISLFKECIHLKRHHEIIFFLVVLDKSTKFLKCVKIRFIRDKFFLVSISCK